MQNRFLVLLNRSISPQATAVKRVKLLMSPEPFHLGMNRSDKTTPRAWRTNIWIVLFHESELFILI
jgi:hypothetical protein